MFGVKTKSMEEHITALIKADVDRAMFAHLSRKFLEIDANLFTTDNAFAILHFMNIEPTDEILQTYFDSVNSVRVMENEKEVKGLPKLIFDQLATYEPMKED